MRWSMARPHMRDVVRLVISFGANICYKPFSVSVTLVLKDEVNWNIHRERRRAIHAAEDGQVT